MIIRLGILGDSNTGKTKAWSFYRRPEEVFSISPTNKLEVLGDSIPGKEPYRVSDLHISYKKMSELDTIHHFCGQSIEYVDKDGKHVRKTGRGDLVLKLVNELSLEEDKDLAVTGDNLLVTKLRSVAIVKMFVSQYMPQKRILLTHDFSHFLNSIMASKEFREAKSGDAAYAKFWTMAADAVDNIFFSSNYLRDGMIDATEFHIQLDPGSEKYDIFTTGGKMLQEKFKGKSYFDIGLFTKVDEFPENITSKEQFMAAQHERFKFVAVNKGYFDGRDAGILANLMDFKGEINNYKITEIIDAIYDYMAKKQYNPDDL